MSGSSPVGAGAIPPSRGSPLGPWSGSGSITVQSSCLGGGLPQALWAPIGDEVRLIDHGRPSHARCRLLLELPGGVEQHARASPFVRADNPTLAALLYEAAQLA